MNESTCQLSRHSSVLSWRQITPFHSDYTQSTRRFVLLEENGQQGSWMKAVQSCSVCVCVCVATCNPRASSTLFCLFLLLPLSKGRLPTLFSKQVGLFADSLSVFFKQIATRPRKTFGKTLHFLCLLPLEIITIVTTCLLVDFALVQPLQEQTNPSSSPSFRVETLADKNFALVHHILLIWNYIVLIVPFCS